MYIVYDTITKQKESKEVVVNYPSERYYGEDSLNYTLNLEKSIKENLFPKRLNDKELYELIDVLNQIEENQLGQGEIVEMLERASTKRLKALSKNFKINIKIGKSIVETLKEIKVPRYIIMSLESAQKGGKLGNTYINIMEILKLRLDTEKKIAKILRYPKIVMSFLLVYFFAIIYYIIPATAELINMMDPEKFPEISKKLYAMSEYGNSHEILFTIMTLLATALTYKTLYFMFGKLLMFVPAIRKIGEYKDISLFFSILASLQESGIMLHNGIKFSSEVISNKKMRDDLLKIGKKLQKEGGSFYEHLNDFKFEDQVKTFVYYGEKTGKSNVYYRNIKNIYSEKMNSQIDIALEFINPVTMIFTVTIMLTLYIGVNAPLFTFGDIQ